MTPRISLRENGGCLRMLRILTDPAFLVGVIRKKGEAICFTFFALVPMTGVEPVREVTPTGF